MPRLGDLGERDLVRRLTEGLPTRRNVAGLADDAAALRFGDAFLVASTDTFHAATHFPTWASAEDMGWLAAAATLSDVVAMGAAPLGILLATGAPADLDADTLEGVVRGAAAAADAAGAELLGGDTKEQPFLSLTGTGVGTTPRPVLRSGARPGDVVVATGAFGGAAAALADDLSQDPRAREALLRPRPRHRQGVALREAGATAMMDVSDGLAHTLGAIADASGVQVVLDVEAVPVHPLATAAEDPRALALHGGGEYELVAALPAPVAEGLAGAVDDVVAVGKVREGSGLVDAAGYMLSRAGWEHFRSTAPGRNDNV